MDDFKQKFKRYWKYLLLVVVISIIPIIVYILVIIPFPPSLGVSRDAWTGFYGSIFGCTVGGVISGLVVYMVTKYQIHSNNKETEKNRNEIIKQNIISDLIKKLNILFDEQKSNLKEHTTVFQEYYTKQFELSDEQYITIKRELMILNDKIFQKLTQMTVESQVIQYMGNELYSRAHEVIELNFRYCKLTSEIVNILEQKRNSVKINNDIELAQVSSAFLNDEILYSKVDEILKLSIEWGAQSSLLLQKIYDENYKKYFS